MLSNSIFVPLTLLWHTFDTQIDLSKLHVNYSYTQSYDGQTKDWQ